MTLASKTLLPILLQVVYENWNLTYSSKQDNQVSFLAKFINGHVYNKRIALTKLYVPTGISSRWARRTCSVHTSSLVTLEDQLYFMPVQLWLQTVYDDRLWEMANADITTATCIQILIPISLICNALCNSNWVVHVAWVVMRLGFDCLVNKLTSTLIKQLSIKK